MRSLFPLHCTALIADCVFKRQHRIIASFLPSLVKNTFLSFYFFLSRNNFSLLRERLGIDRPLVVAASGTQILDKREKEAVNLVARASGEGRAIVRPHPAKDPFEPWEMTAQEREVANKYVRLIQYHCPTR